MKVKKKSLAQGLGLIWSTERGKKAILGVHSEQGVCPALICGHLNGPALHCQSLLPPPSGMFSPPGAQVTIVECFVQTDTAGAILELLLPSLQQHLGAGGNSSQTPGQFLVHSNTCKGGKDKLMVTENIELYSC